MMVHLSQRNIVFVVLFWLKIYLSDGAIDVNNNESSALNIAIIGAGPAGIVSARHSIADGHNVTVYEQNEEIGGVWVYTDNVSKNKYGLDIHTAMYKGLRTNAPLPVMEFPEMIYPNDTSSFPQQSDILEYLHSYADRFNLGKYIKLNHLVAHVHPIENEKWELIVKDLANDKFITQTYDVVLVCNGHYFAPFTPAIEGANEFKGSIMHSHIFRTAEAFRGEKVLVVGSGFSGTDLVNLLSNETESVTLSKRNWLNETKEAQAKYESSLPKKTFVKDIVKRLTAEGAEFIDGSQESFSTIIFATGYKFSYPFLSVDSGIHLDDNYIQPLYKHVINIDHPTMALIGVPRAAMNFRMFDLQARFVLKMLSKEKSLPSKYDMLKDEQFEAEKLWKKGYPKSKTHSVTQMQKEYFNQLSVLADIENVPGILVSLALESAKKRDEAPTEYRNYKYTVVDERTFTRENLKTN